MAAWASIRFSPLSSGTSKRWYEVLPSRRALLSAFKAAPFCLSQGPLIPAPWSVTATLIIPTARLDRTAAVVGQHPHKSAGLAWSGLAGVGCSPRQISARRPG